MDVRLGFYAVMESRLLTAWSPLLDRDNPQHALLLPILRNCVDEHGSPVVPTSDDAQCAQAPSLGLRR